MADAGNIQQPSQADGLCSWTISTRPSDTAGSPPFARQQGTATAYPPQQAENGKTAGSAAASRKGPKVESGVIIEGVENCLVKFSRCCTPIPGDDIIGFVTKGYGVSIHRKDCPNVRALDKTHDKGRWIKVYWAEETNDRYETSIEISAKDRPDLVVDIMTALSSMKVPVSALNARRYVDGYDSISVAIDIKDLDQLKLVAAKLNHLSGVVQVTRKGFDS